MTLLGKPLDEIRRAQAGRRFSNPTAMKIGMQMIRVRETFLELKSVLIKF